MKSPWYMLLAFVAAMTSCNTESVTNKAAIGMSAEARLVTFLHERIERRGQTARPVSSSAETVLVHFGINLVQITDFDVKNQRLETLMWKRFQWKVNYLRWNSSEYGGVQEVAMPATLLWVPDIVLYNNVGHRDLEKMRQIFRLRVLHTGYVQWIPPTTHESSCKVFMKEYPFDVQTCVLVFGSWAHDSSKLNMTFFGGLERADLGEYVVNSGWEIVNNTIERKELQYPCCSYPFIEMHLTLTLKRRVTFQMRLILIPTVLLSVLVLAIFWIPPFRPDRAMFGFSLLSCFLLLLIVVVSSSPPSADSGLGDYYIVVIVIIGTSVMLSMTSINLAHTTREMPHYLVGLLHGKLGALLCLSKKKATNNNNNNELESDDNTHTRHLPANKWHALADVTDRIFFIICAPVMFICFLCVFPKPLRLFEI